MAFEQEQQLISRTRTDAEFQTLLQQCAALESEFLRIRNSLPEDSQGILDEYICLCEELEYRRTCLALEL